MILLTSKFNKIGMLHRSLGMDWRFLLHIHMAHGDDLHAIKYLPLKLKGPARHWLNSLPENSIGSWEDLEDAFRDNIQGTYVRPPDADDLSHIVQQPGESAQKL